MDNNFWARFCFTQFGIQSCKFQHREHIKQTDFHDSVQQKNNHTINSNLWLAECLWSGIHTTASHFICK